MPIITFLPENITIEASAGTKLSEAAQKAKVRIALPCAGKGVCGKCLVKITKGAVAFENNGKLSDELIKEGYVLACRSKVTEDAAVELPASLEEEEGSFCDAMSHIGIGDYLFPKKDELSPMAVCREITVSAPEMLDGLGDLDRFCAAFEGETGKKPHVPLEVLRSLPDVLRENDGKVFVWSVNKAHTADIVDIKAEKRADYGVCIDIGTTTVAVQLVDMEKGSAVGAATDYNAQIERGMDVISRISYAKTQEKREEMRALVLKTLNGCIKKAAKAAGADKSDIRSAVVSGNTTMTQLFFGIVPEYIRLEPYTPAVMASPIYTAAEAGVEINKCAPVLVSPNVGSYVGGDITAGLLCTDFAADSEDIDLFIDIGTNGEIVFGGADFLLGCACSAGPAFEGGGIEMGMRASAGAIEASEVNDDGSVSYSVIGGGEAKGICGSGLISLVAQLFEKGIIDPRGKFDRSGKFKNIESDGRSAKYYIAPPKSGRGVYITEADIDNLIRAKAAIFSACRTLLKSVEMDFESISHFYIAGGFGRYIDVEKAQTIGLLPAIDKDKFVFIGNSSLTGSHMALISEKHRSKISALAGKITYIDLSTEPSYMDEYISAMFIPHTDEKLFAKE